MKLHRILMTDSNPEALSPYRVLLEDQGFETMIADGPEEVLKIIDSEHVDLLITGLKSDVAEDARLISAFREDHPQIPILVLTERDDLMTKSRVYGAGIDEYVTYDACPAEVLLHVKALLRRYHISCERRVEFPHTRLDYDLMTISVNNQETLLPLKEFLLLFKLVSYPGKIFSREELLDEIWGKDSSSVTQTVDVHINRLRKKLQDNPDFAITTVRGAGYRAEIKCRG